MGGERHCGLRVRRLFLWSPVVWSGAMYYVVIAFLAVVVVACAWIALEAKMQFRRRSRAISSAHEKGQQ